MKLGPAAYSLATISSRMLANIGIFFILASSISADEFGLVTYYFAVAVILGVVVDYGFNLKLSRDFAIKGCDNLELISRVLNVKILNFILVSILSSLYFFVVKAPFQSAILLVMFWFYQFIQSVAYTYYPLLRSQGRFKEESKITLTNNFLVIVVFLIVILTTPYQLLAMPFAFIVGRMYVLYKFLMSGYFVLKPKHFKKLIATYSTGFSFFVHTAIAFLYFNLDTVLLKEFTSFDDIGRYQVLMKVIVGVLILSEVITNIYLPKLTQNYSQKKVEDFVCDSKKVIGISVVLGIVMTLVALLLYLVIGNVFDKEYVILNNVTVMLLLVTVFLRYMAVYFSMYLTIVNQQGKRVISSSLSLIILVSVILIWGSEYGLMAAALAVFFANLSILIMYFYFTYKDYKGRFKTVVAS